MKLTFLAGAVALAFTGTVADAATVITWNPGSGVLPTGSKVIENFDAIGAGTSIGTNAFAFNANSDKGARPAIGSTGNYAAVAGGGSYTIRFGAASALSFVLGSLDDYNALDLLFADNTKQTLRGSGIINIAPPPYADGNQKAGYTNGVVSYAVGKSDPKLVGAVFRSGWNSFEFDNIAVTSAVPEPGTWAMLIAGVGVMGMGLRQRRRPTPAFAAA